MNIMKSPILNYVLFVVEIMLMFPGILSVVSFRFLRRFLRRCQERQTSSYWSHWRWPPTL